MSHVDEGTLHAYLDGALDAVLPAGEAARVRQHLELCDACAARLREEKELREEAAQILGLSAPPLGDLPAFEELRARAEAEPEPAERRPSGGRRLQRMAWAASVVLAVGAGWLLRGASAPWLQDRGPSTAGAVQGAAGRAVSGADSDAAPPTTVAEVAQPAPEREKQARSEEKAAPSAPEATNPVVIPEPEPFRTAAAPSLVSPPPANALDSLSALLDSISFPRTAEAARQATGQAAAPSSGSPGAFAPYQRPRTRIVEPSGTNPPVSDAARRGDASGAMKAVAATDERTAEASRVAAPAAGGLDAGGDRASLSVPGLTVVSVVRLDARQVAGAIRVRQLLESGDTLEIIHLPPGVRPSALSPVPEGETELVVVRDDGWLVLRARASRDILDDMAHRLDRSR